MKAWWEQLARREQLFLLGGGLIAVLLLGYVALWQPLRGALHDARTRQVALRQELHEMQRIAGQVRVLRARARQQAHGGGGNLLTDANGAATRLGLGTALTRVRPQGDKRLQVWFQQAAFNDLVRWLQRMQDQGVSVHAISVQRQDQPGLVTARVTLER